jgi:hypothetical protein
MKVRDKDGARFVEKAGQVSLRFLAIDNDKFSPIERFRETMGSAKTQIMETCNIQIDST